MENEEIFGLFRIEFSDNNEFNIKNLIAIVDDEEKAKKFILTNFGYLVGEELENYWIMIQPISMNVKGFIHRPPVGLYKYNGLTSSYVSIDDKEKYIPKKKSYEDYCYRGYKSVTLGLIKS